MGGRVGVGEKVASEVELTTGEVPATKVENFTELAGDLSTYLLDLGLLFLLSCLLVLRVNPAGVIT